MIDDRVENQLTWSVKSPLTLLRQAQDRLFTKEG